MKVNVPDLNLPRVVIVGGGFGGITLAQSLKGVPVQVVMFDRNNYHVFQPLLYQVATGGLEPDSIAFPLRKLFKRREHFHFRMAEVQRIDTAASELHTSIGSIHYDYLVLATGSRTNFFGNEEVERNAHGMKNIPEALDLRSLILQNFEKALLTSDLAEREALMNFVVVGAGPTGVETAGALSELKRHILPVDYPELDLRKMQIHLVEAGPRVLAGMSPESGANAADALEKLGVHLWLNTRVTAYDGSTVQMDTGKQMLCTTLIWAAGVAGCPVAGLDAAVGKGARIAVDQFNRVKGTANVFAIGDVACMDAEGWPGGHPMVAPVAMQQGTLLGRNIRDQILGKKMQPFVYRDKGSMATVGRNKAVVDLGKTRFKGWIAWMMWMGLHLFSLAGFRNRMVVFINWFWSYVTYDKGTRLIIRPFRRKQPEFQHAPPPPAQEAEPVH